MDISILNNLKNEATLIVPSRRLSTSVKAQVQKEYAKSASAWQTPLVCSLDDWLQALWEQYEIQGVTKQLLLSPMQSLLAFEDIIAKSQSGKTLLRQHQAAKTALQAWHQLNHWLCEDTLNDEPENVDQAAFKEWAQTYQAWLNDNHCIDQTLVVGQILNLIEQCDDAIIKRISPIKILYLYGFEELSPKVSYFFERLSQSGWQIEHVVGENVIPQSLHRIAFNQKEQEYANAALWAKKCLAQNQQATIIVPNLADERTALEAVFRDCFEPEHVILPSMHVCSTFNISAATPLIQYPLINAGMGFLGLAFNSNDIAQLAILNSPFAKGANEEQYARMQLRGRLKEKIIDKLFLNDLLVFLKNQHDIQIPVLKEMLCALLEKTAKQPKLQPFYQWMMCFREILSIAGWPGESPLNSVEYQLVSRMDALLNEMGECDAVLAPVDGANALTLLQKVASNIPFQAENKGAPIQILGLIEGAGQTFENVWIMGMDSEAWPMEAKPNPFIPVKLQHDTNMPHANAARELAYAKNLTSKLKECATNIVFSHCLKDKEKSLSVSVLIKNVPEIKHDATNEAFRCESLFKEVVGLEERTDDYAPPLSALECFEGTSKTLMLQAMCPFKAFAEQRLHLHQPELRQIWLQAYQQGNILHNILEDFWGAVKTQDNLNKHTLADLQEIMARLIDKHLLKTLSNQAPPVYITTEKNKLITMLMDYLDLEKQRVPFEVMMMEKKFHYSLADINFSLRLDRMDKDVYGNNVIVDYKTGKSGFYGTWGERLEAPQFPLYYCASLAYQPKTIVAIKLNSKSCDYEGVSDEESGIPGVERLSALSIDEKPQDWQSLYPYWQEKLTALINEFKEGYAKASPLRGNQTCRYCHLSAVCRIDEVNLHDE